MRTQNVQKGRIADIMGAGHHNKLDIETLKRYFGCNASEAGDMLNQGHMPVINGWTQARIENRRDERIWYAQTTAHMTEGLAWHAQPSMKRIRERIARIAGNTYASTYSGSIRYPTILCYGCGVGTEGILAINEGAHVTFVDYQHMLDFVKCRISVWDEYGVFEEEVPVFSNLQDKHGDVLFSEHYTHRVIQFESLDNDPVEDPRAYLMEDAFDTIICLDVLEHVELPELILGDFRFWLKPGGLFIGSAPFSELQWPGHLEKHKDKDLKVMAAEHGFERVLIDPLRENFP